jgi:membrane fusion protein (multidrug efflux system)
MTTESDGDAAGGAIAEEGADRPRAAVAEDTHTDAPPGSARKAKGLLHRPAVLIVAGVALFVLVALSGTLWWLHARHFESTDDAFIDTHLVHLAPQIAGQVVAVSVDDNQLVQVGQLLVVIASADTQAKVAQARAQRAQAQAQLANAQGQILVNEASRRQSQADAAAAQAQATIAAVDLARFERLAAINPAAVAQQQLDQARTARDLTAAQSDSAVRATQVRTAQVAASRTLVTAAVQQVAVAQAQFDEAGINLGYARIESPIAGHVAQKSVAVGQYVQPGTQILAIVPTQLFITANFKETQLSLVRAGQAVTVAVDACPAAAIRGHVDSIQRGAGQAFAILPPENATGNFVKVVQRVPVKIVLEEVPADCVLGPGMSVEPQVRVR